jgi:Na+/H+ antiporter NhaD/arsenite permease-like protein
LLYFRGLGKVRLELAVEKVVSWLPTVLLVGMVLGLAAISFASAGGLHASSGILCLALALAGLGWLVLVRKEPLKAARGLLTRLDWETILFLVGIFIVIGAIGDIGLLDDLARILSSIVGGRVVIGFIVMLPVAAKLASSLSIQSELLMFGLLIGSCLGGNLTPFGASANVVAMSLAKKEDAAVGFTSWIRIGAPFTLLTTAASSLLVYLIWR